MDDAEEFRTSMQDILELRDWQVETASDGSEALELVSSREFDLVLMDVKMPGMDGVEAFQRMRRIAPRTAVILVTAYAVEERVKEALRAGAFGMVRKPVEIDLLFELIDRALCDDDLVLVADDDTETCTRIRDALVEPGYRVSIATNQSTALEMAFRSDFDVVLLDLRLPPTNAYEACLAIRDIRPKIVAIIINGELPEIKGLIDRTLAPGKRAYLDKPIDTEKLIVTLDSLIRRQ